MDDLISFHYEEQPRQVSLEAARARLLTTLNWYSDRNRNFLEPQIIAFAKNYPSEALTFIKSYGESLSTKTIGAIVNDAIKNENVTNTRTNG